MLILFYIRSSSPSINKMVGLAKIVNGKQFRTKDSVLSDTELRQKTQEFKEHILKKSKVYESEIQELEEALLSVAIPEEKERIKEKLKITRNKIFEDVLPEVFALVREAAKRTVNMRHFDAQIAGGIVPRRQNCRDGYRRR